MGRCTIISLTLIATNLLACSGASPAKGQPSGGSAWSPQGGSSPGGPTGATAPLPTGERIVARDARHQEFPSDTLAVFARRSFYDKTRDEKCKPMLISDTEVACLPTYSTRVRYTEASCTNPIYAHRAASGRSDLACVETLPAWAAVTDFSGTGLRATRGQVVAFYGVGAAVSGVTKAYQRVVNDDGSTSCNEVTETGLSFYALQPAQMSDFAKFDLQWQTGVGGKLKKPVPTNASGQKLLDVFDTQALDVANNAACHFFASTGSVCEISDAAFLYDVYTSNSCGGTALKAAYGTSTSPFAYKDDGEIYRATPSASISAYELADSSCVQAGTFTPYTVSEEKVVGVTGSRERRGSGRIKANIIVADGVEFASHFEDPVTSEICIETVDETGKLRCVTAVEQTYGFYYTDSGCTERVIPLMDGENEIKPRFTATSHCETEKVFELGSEIAQNSSVYELTTDGKCTLIRAADFTGKKFRLGSEILLSTFPQY